MPTFESASPQRILSIDILRGLTIALMIVVNNPGDGTHVWWPLEHAEWNGYTLTDLVFPTFLFLVGCSIVFSMAGRLARGADRTQLALHVVRRSVILVLIGWFLGLMPYFHLTTLRFYGVLPRIGLCYLVAGLLFLRVQRPRALAGVSLVFLVSYWALMRFMPVPGAGVPTHEIPLLDMNQNLVAWVDRLMVGFTQRWFHTGRLYETVRDPEGLISTLPAIATALLGILTGLSLRGAKSTPKKALLLGVFGVSLLVAGYLWSPWFPINKNLWTSSYVLVCAGWALFALAPLYWLLDVRGSHLTSRLCAALIWPWQVFGSNAIAAYVVSAVFIKILSTVRVGVTDTGRPLSLLRWIYAHLFARHASTEITSHLFAVAFMMLCFLPIWFLWRRRIFLRI